MLILTILSVDHMPVTGRVLFKVESVLGSSAGFIPQQSKMAVLVAIHRVDALHMMHWIFCRRLKRKALGYYKKKLKPQNLVLSFLMYVV